MDYLHEKKLNKIQQQLIYLQTTTRTAAPTTTVFRYVRKVDLHSSQLS